MDQIQKEQVKQQIIQATDSTKEISERQIKHSTNRLIKDQIGREKVYYKRANFLKGNGYTLEQDFTNRVKHAAVGKSLEKKPANKAQRKMTKEFNREIREGYEATKEEMQVDEAQQRKDLEQQEKYKHIHSVSFATEYQYEVLGNAKKWMMDNPEAYAKNRKAVNAIYKDLRIADEAYGAMSRESRYYDFMKKKNRAMEREVDRRVFVLSDRQKFLEHRLVALSDGLQYLLRGKEISDMAKETLQKYQKIGPTNMQKQEAAKKAGKA